MKSIEVVNNQVIAQNMHNNDYSVVPYAYHISAIDMVQNVTGKNINRMYRPAEIKQAYIEAGDILGVSVKYFVKMMKGALHRAYIVPEIDLHNRFDWSCARWLDMKGKAKTFWERDTTIVNQVNNHTSILKQYISDGNENIVGFGMVAGDSYASKYIFGKSLWRKLRNNSKSRNDIICKVHMKANMTMPPKKIKQFITMLNNMPTTTLKTLGHDMCLKVWYNQRRLNMEDIVPKINKHLNVPLCKITGAAINGFINEIQDCANMRENFNPDWSIIRIKREHALGVKELFNKKYGHDKFKLVEHYPNVIEDEENEYTATLMTTPFNVAVHGKEQHHCVGSYIDDVHKERYIVYKIQKGENISTLGIGLIKDKFPRTQHTGVCNATIINDKRLAFAEVVKSKVFKVAATRSDFINVNITPTVGAAFPLNHLEAPVAGVNIAAPAVVDGGPIRLGVEGAPYVQAPLPQQAPRIGNLDFGMDIPF